MTEFLPPTPDDPSAGRPAGTAERGGTVERDGRARRHVLAGRWDVVAFALLLLVAWGASVAHVGLRLRVHPDADLIHGHDDRHYFATAHSLWIDGDLHFANEFARLLPELADAAPTPAGRPPNKYGIGMPLLAGPPLWLVRGASAAGLGASDAMGAGAQALYIAWFTMLGLAGVAVTAWAMAAVVGRGAAMLAAAAMLPGSSLLWYAVMQPTMAHATTVLLGALLLWGWARRCVGGDLRARWLVLMGVAVGLSASTRWQDAPLGLVVAVAEAGRFGAAWRAARGEPLVRRRALVSTIAAGATFGAAALAGIAPQLVYQRIVWGAWLTDAYAAGGEGFRWLQPGLAGLLFSTRNSLFFYAPLTLLATWGMAWAALRETRRAPAEFAEEGALAPAPCEGRAAWAALLATFVAHVYVNAAWWAWWMGHAFGARGLLNSWVLLTAGLAWLFARAARWSARARRALGVAVAVAIAWTFLMLALYQTSTIPHDGSGWAVTSLPERVGEMVGRVGDKAARALGAGDHGP